MDYKLLSIIIGMEAMRRGADALTASEEDLSTTGK